MNRNAEFKSRLDNELDGITYTLLHPQNTMLSQGFAKRVLVEGVFSNNKAIDSSGEPAFHSVINGGGKKAAITIAKRVYLIPNVWRVHKYIDF